MIHWLCLVLCNPTGMACSHANESAVLFPTILQGFGQGSECKDNRGRVSSALVLTDTAGRAAPMGLAVLA